MHEINSWYFKDILMMLCAMERARYLWCVVRIRGTRRVSWPVNNFDKNCIEQTVHIEHCLYVNIIYIDLNIAWNTLLCQAGTAVAVFDEVFSVKSNVSVPTTVVCVVSNIVRQNFEHNIKNSENKIKTSCTIIYNYHFSWSSEIVVMIVKCNAMIHMKQTM